MRFIGRNGNEKGRLLAGAALLMGLVALVLAFVPGGRSSLPASAAAGDIHLDFVAAEDTTYVKHDGVTEGNQIGTTEGQDLGFDDRTINTDVVEQLEAEDFACGDRIVFFTQVVVDASATDTNQTIFLIYDFDAVNNGQPGVGYKQVLDVGISGVDFPVSQPPGGAGDPSGEDGNVGLDGTESATLVSQVYEPGPAAAPPAGFEDPDADHLVATVKITGLDPGEQLIVRTDVRFSCFAGSPPPTGNLHAAISDGFFDNGDGTLGAGDKKISVGQQDVPMLGLGQEPTPTSTPTLTPTPTPTPTLTPTPTPTATSTSTPTPTATSTSTPTPTATSTSTPTPTATSTSTPTPTATSTSTPTPTATSTSTPTPTATSTSTPTATATSTSTPTATSTSTPTATSTSTPTATSTSTPTATSTSTPTATSTSTPTATSTSTPTATATATPAPSPTAVLPAFFPLGGLGALTEDGSMVVMFAILGLGLIGCSAWIFWSNRRRWDSRRS